MKWLMTTKHRSKRCRIVTHCITLVLLLTFSGMTKADDNVLAHRLFSEGKYAQAGEIFTDPAWKGVALYRSSQWWRAAEAFVRANDAVSVFNLGNSYVKLGYHALALDAYLQALSIDPTLEDASFNADIMRQLLAAEDDNKKRSGRNPEGEEIEKLDTDAEPDEQGEGQGGDEQSDVNETPTGKSEDPGAQTMGPQSDAQSGKGAEASQQQSPNDENQDGGGAVQGETSDKSEANRPSGGSETDTPADESQAAGMRASLEAEQATTQWLNRISHDSQLFLQRRIQLELKRRRAAGQSAPDGGSNW